VSDFGSDVRPGPLAADHVLGIGAASLTLVQATPRRRADRALDLGTGCGVQALHLARHAHDVVATDVSVRALRMAATTAALSGQRWELRAGSMLEPVAGERFDVIVANPPFVVSPGLRRGAGGYDYRDSGLAGDAVSAALLRGLPELLAPDGTASVLANWIIPADGDWAGRVGAWLAGTGCDAWVWQREVLDPGAYTTLWLRDAGETPGTPRWTRQYRAWLDWFSASQVAAVGMGLATLRRTGHAEPTVVCEDVRQAVEQPAGPAIDVWFARQRWLADVGDDALLASTLRCVDGLVRTQHALRAAAGWRTELTLLRQNSGLRWEIEVDDAVSGVVAACDGTVPLAVPVAVLAACVGRGIGEVGQALLPVVRDLVSRGFLEPVRPAPEDEMRSGAEGVR
jgi:SAM-dependent methyltransferase